MINRSKIIVMLLSMVLLFPTSSIPAAQDNPSKRGIPITVPERRIALVIGNADYGQASLKNPLNDARVMAQTLESLGFSVTIGLNMTKDRMRLAVIRFGRAIKKGGVGLFYYAGHGVQVGGRNYLIPVDAVIEDQEVVPVESMGVGYVMARMAAARNRLNIVILDACRDNPFERSFRSGGAQGLAQVRAPRGTLVAYATAPGQVAADGAGQHGTYTGALIKNIKKPGLRIEDVFKLTRTEVVRATDGKQTPWESSSIMGDFYFAGVEAKAKQPQAVAGPEPTPQTAASQRDGQKEKITALLKAAEAHLAADRLTTPAGANAMEIFKEALRLDPGNEKAWEGLRRIVGRYVEMAEAQAGRGNLARARLFLDRAEKVIEGDQRVARARAELEGSKPENRETQPPVAALPSTDGGRLKELKRELRIIRAGMNRIKTDIEQGQEADSQTLDRLLALTGRQKELETGIAALEAKIRKAREEREARQKKEKAEQERKAKEARLARLQADIDKYNRIAAATKDKALLQVAWQSLTAKYPEARDLDQGDVGGLLMKAGYGMETYTNSIGMRFVAIPPGNFLMGSPKGIGGDDEHPQHRAEISRAFLLGVTEVTQAQWQTIMGSNPSKFKGSQLPVENISWNDARKFIHRLNAKEDTNKYRLPTEAEWEYACRAGSDGKWTFGNDENRLKDYAWYEANSGGRTHPVGGKRPNAWGLYDMHGNAREWCQDWYDSDFYQQSPSRDPQGPASGSSRAIRGGSWFYDPSYARCAYRFGVNPVFTSYGVGFRLARTP